MSTKRPRIQCPCCDQTLSYSAYCRHQQLQRSKPTGPSPAESSDDSENESLPLIISDHYADSEHSEQEHEVGDLHGLTPSISESSDRESESENNSKDEGDVEVLPDSASSSQSESESENEVSNGKDFPFVLCLFLVVFQLCYRLSDRGVRHLLVFISSSIKWLSAAAKDKLSLVHLTEKIPQTLYSMRKLLSVTNHLQKYVVCSKCHCLYKESDCLLRGLRGTLTSRKCDFAKFPNHPHVSRRAKCGAELMKMVKVRGKYKLVPKKVFVYNSIIKSLSSLVSREGFLEQCEAWRRNAVSDDFMTDVYDGQLWKDWQRHKDQPFLETPGNLLLMLNVDWFQPFKHTPYSAGVMYLVIQNLPRTLRFKPENILVVGTIPGPKEPKIDINSYLKPMINELLELFKGVQIDTPHSVLGSRRIRAALACICSDIPATRKLCGFYGLKAKRGCSKCMKPFIAASFSESPDYSGFDREEWTPRCTEIHREKALESKAKNTASSQEAIQREVGVRYSELLRLSYFDIVRCHLIDPMHNLFLGTAKHVMTMWKDEGVLSKADFDELQDRVDAINVPQHIGRIPSKISSGFSGFTAEQWKSWTVIYSPIVLQNLLPDDHYHMWSLFSLACSLLCRPFISKSEINRGDEVLMEFCQAYERIFGGDKVTPNMHLHGHLKECLIDMGPVYSFWCFSFERYNGIMENMQKNWISPEIQLMKKFVTLQALNFTKLPITTPADLLQCYHEMKRYHNAFVEKPNLLFDSKSLLHYERNLFCQAKEVCSLQLSCHEVVAPIHEKYFTDDDRQLLTKCYSTIYSNNIVHISLRYEEVRQVKVFGKLFSSLKARSCRSAGIVSLWAGISGSILDRIPTEEDIRIGVVQYYFRHFPKMQTPSGTVQETPHLFARVKWYQDHPRKFWLKHGTVVAASLFDNESETSFLPVSRILSRCALVTKSLSFDFGEDRVTVGIPLIRRIDM